jgi:hypothetical protein
VHALDQKPGHDRPLAGGLGKEHDLEQTLTRWGGTLSMPTIVVTEVTPQARRPADDRVVECTRCGARDAADDVVLERELARSRPGLTNWVGVVGLLLLILLMLV